MKLDRNDNTGGKGKYALIHLRELPGDPQTPEDLAAAILAHPECVEFGAKGSDGEFFLIKLKDRFAPAALQAYAEAVYASESDDEWGHEVGEMARRAKRHPGRKQPD